MRADFTELDLDAQARLKEAFDPAGIFNPAKVLPEGSRCFDFGGVRREIPDGAWYDRDRRGRSRASRSLQSRNWPRSSRGPRRSNASSMSSVAGRDRVTDRRLLPWWSR